ncbi:MAG: SURF1 family protein [Thiomonas sp.]|uniref:SURF1 family protein n=1 Tax=Thiomonas sp. TaxID=2047785 RepID=UPI002A35BEFC|nr:SURF1 family protein [Thiomonas sp.]MDY0329427.1 SURF1 family protein [Thiomonas sp.]
MSEQITSDSGLPMSEKAFGPKELLIVILGLLVIGVTMSLGFWQLGRAHEKEALNLQMDQRERAHPLQIGQSKVQLSEDVWRRAQARGVYATQWTIYLQNRQQNGQTGFWVLTPLKLAGSDTYLMVLRGWLPRNFQAMDLIGPYQTPRGLTVVDGLIAPPPSKWFSFFTEPPGQVIRQNVDLRKYADFHHIQLLPFVLRQSGDLHDGLGRQWPAANTGAGTNYGYAAQWFGMSATGAVLLLYFVYRRLRQAKAGHDAGDAAATRAL